MIATGRMVSEVRRRSKSCIEVRGAGPRTESEFVTTISIRAERKAREGMYDTGCGSSFGYCFG